MRHVPLLDSYVFAALIGFALAVLVLLGDKPAMAGEAFSANDFRCSCPESGRKSTRPKFADLTGRLLDESDEVAALESIQMGLAQMDDGQPFVWKRQNGRISGVVRPTVSFRNADGRICRHVVVLLTTGYKTRTAEGIACRMADRRWALEG